MRTDGALLVADRTSAMQPVSGPTTRTIWEAGHFYLAKGPTIWSEAGWNLLASLADPEDARMLFLDDVHALSEVDPVERNFATIDFDPSPEPTHIITESSMLPVAEQAIEQLKQLSKRRRVRKSGGLLRCSGFPLKSRSGNPLCLLYDLGLTWHKRELGFTRAVNIVPEFYEREQRRLLRLVQKAMPEFDLQIILHDTTGAWRQLEART